VRTRRLGARRARVERIRDEVAAGSYAVDAHAVADALLGRLRAVGRLP
jgi:anti-sigma28 factor (negative regulator of flagellin synthesis)